MMQFGAQIVIEYAKRNGRLWRLSRREIDQRVAEIVGPEIFGQPLVTSHPDRHFVKLIHLLSKRGLDGGSFLAEDACDDSYRRITVNVAARHSKIRDGKESGPTSPDAPS